MLRGSQLSAGWYDGSVTMLSDSAIRAHSRVLRWQTSASRCTFHRPAESFGWVQVRTGMATPGLSTVLIAGNCGALDGTPMTRSTAVPAVTVEPAPITWVTMMPALSGAYLRLTAPTARPAFSSAAV